MKKIIFCFLALISLLSSIFSETPEPYKPEEFPGILHDLRRAEIITLGAMPFITFNVSLGYSFGNYASHNFDYSYFKNPFAQDSESSYSQDEQIGILLTSIGISAGIGITDFIVHSVKRNKQYRKLKKTKNKNITVSPIETDPDATKIEYPEPPVLEESQLSQPEAFTEKLND